MRLSYILLAAAVLLTPTAAIAQTEHLPQATDGTSVSATHAGQSGPLADKVMVSGPISIAQKTKKPTPQSGPISDGGALAESTAVGIQREDGSVLRPPNIVTMTVIPAGCANQMCVKTFRSHNSRVDQGAQYTANQLSNAASASGTVLADYIALSSDNTAPAHGDFCTTTCTGEYTSAVGLARALATYGNYTAPSSLNGTATYTLSASYNATGAYNINKLYLLTAASGGQLMFETLLGATVSGGNGDTINVVWTVNCFTLPFFFPFYRRMRKALQEAA